MAIKVTVGPVESTAGFMSCGPNTDTGITSDPNTHTECRPNKRSTESASFTFGRNQKKAESDVTHSAETVCAIESKVLLSVENRNRKSIESEPNTW